jgi:hypothetical protein
MTDIFQEEYHKTYLTSRDLAQRLSRSIETIRRWRWAGKGPKYIKIGKYYYYDLVDVINFESQQTVEKYCGKTL